MNDVLVQWFSTLMAVSVEQLVRLDTKPARTEHHHGGDQWQYPERIDAGRTRSVIDDLVDLCAKDRRHESAEVAQGVDPVSYTHLTLPTTPYV